MPWCYSKKKMSDDRSEIHLVQRNIFSTGQYFQALKKSYSGMHTDIKCLDCNKNYEKYSEKHIGSVIETLINSG